MSRAGGLREQDPRKSSMGPETKANECIANKLSKAAVLIKYFPEGPWQFVKSGGPFLFSFEAATQTECFPQDP